MCLFSSSAASAPPPVPAESVEKIPEYDGRDLTDQARDKALRRRRILYGHGSDRLDQSGIGKLDTTPTDRDRLDYTGGFLG